MPSLTGIQGGLPIGGGVQPQRTERGPGLSNSPPLSSTGLVSRSSHLHSASPPPVRTATLPQKEEQQFNECVGNFATQMFQKGMEEMESSTKKLFENEEDEGEEPEEE